MAQLDQTHTNNSSVDVTVDLKELFTLLWGGRKLIIKVTSVVALCAMFYALSLTNHYMSSTILSIMKTDESSSIEGMSGLVTFAGISISSDMNKGAMIVNTINSRSFLKKLLTYDDVLPSIMAAKSYDSESKKLIFDPDKYDAANKEWIGVKPDHIRAYGKYRKILTIEYHEVRNTIFLDAEHISPIFAQELLTLIIREADNNIRNMDAKRANEGIAYLTSQLSTTALTEIRASITTLMQHQIEKKMRAGINSNFIIHIIDPPFIPVYKSKPNRSFISLVGIFFGLVIGILWVVVRHFYALSQIKQTSDL